MWYLYSTRAFCPVQYIVLSRIKFLTCFISTTRLALCQLELFTLKMKRYYLGSGSYIEDLVPINESLERSINSICCGIRDLTVGTNQHLPIGM